MSAPNTVLGVKGFVSQPLSTRFMRLVGKIDGNGCWPWRGGRTAPNGYGQIWANGRHQQAHRVSWELAHGKPFPPGLDACHSCDNKWCVNPAHIWPGTPRDNAIDAVRKAPFRPGAKSNAAKTRCKRGHELSGDNVRVRPNGQHRTCRTCAKARKAARAAIARCKP